MAPATVDVIVVGENPELAADPRELGMQSAAIDLIVNSEQFGRVLPDSTFYRLQEQDTQIRKIVRDYDPARHEAFKSGYAYVKNLVAAMASNTQPNFYPRRTLNSNTS